jgi:2-methylisocitrate lyase-like PEP mutase family enzyme
VEWIRKVRSVVGGKPLLFNQIAGGLSPRLSLTELEELGVDVAIYSTPCLFAAHTAMSNALVELRANDGRLAEFKSDDVGVATSIELLENNISRHHPRHRPDLPGQLRAAG